MTAGHGMGGQHTRQIIQRAMEDYDGGGFLPDEEEPHQGSLLGCASCEHCGSLTYSQQYHDAFGVLVCQGCRSLNKYKLVSKSAAKTTFALTDGDLKQLGCISKPNPQHPNWSDMKLYLQSQLMALAIKKHGSTSAISDIKKQKFEARIAGRLDGSKSKLQPEGPHQGVDSEDEDSHAAQKDLNPAQQRVKSRLVQQYGSWEGQGLTTGELPGNGGARQAVAGGISKRRRVGQPQQPQSLPVDTGQTGAAQPNAGIEVEEI